MSKGPFMRYHHQTTDFLSGDLLANTKLLDVSRIGCPPLPDTKIALGILELC